MSSIDIVVPCYRYGRYLKACIDSLLSQGVPNMRVLILDDASPDDTPDVAEALAQSDPRITYRRHEKNMGHIPTFNEGIEWARAEYMLLLSADDYLLPGALQNAIEKMDTHPGVGLCFGEALALTPDGNFTRMPIDIDAGPQGFQLLTATDLVRLFARERANNVIATPTAIVRTRLLHRLGGYRGDLPHTGDMEMWLRLAAHSLVGFIKADQAVYRRHATNMSSDYLRDDGLADLTHRLAAIRVFQQTCEQSAPEHARLHSILLPALARDAIACASGAFNANRMASYQRLQAFALEVWPPIRHHPAWFVLVAKRVLGHRLATALLPTVSLIRATRARIRGMWA